MGELRTSSYPTCTVPCLMLHCAVFQFDENSSINIFITIQCIDNLKSLDNQEKQAILYEIKDNCRNIPILACQMLDVPYTLTDNITITNMDRAVACTSKRQRISRSVTNINTNVFAIFSETNIYFGERLLYLDLFIFIALQKLFRKLLQTLFPETQLWKIIPTKRTGLCLRT